MVTEHNLACRVQQRPWPPSSASRGPVRLKSRPAGNLPTCQAACGAMQEDGDMDPVAGQSGSSMAAVRASPTAPNDKAPWAEFFGAERDDVARDQALKSPDDPQPLAGRAGGDQTCGGGPRR